MAENHKIVAVDENGEEVDEPVVVQGATVDELPSNASFESISTDEAVSDLPLGDEAHPSGMQRIAGAQRNTLQSVQGGDNKTVVSWIWDDGNKSVYDHRSAFEHTGGTVPPSLAIITGNVGSSSSYMTWDEIADLAETYNAEIGNHSHTSDSLADITEEEARDYVNRANYELRKRGYDPEWFVYPLHDDPAYAKQIVSELYGYAFVGDNEIILDNDETYRIPRVDTQAGRPISEIKSEIDAAVNNNTGIVLEGHLIIDGTVSDEGSQEVSTEKIQEIGQYVTDHANAEWGAASETVQHAKTPITQYDSHGTGHKIHGAYREDIAAGYTKNIRDSNGNIIFLVDESGDIELMPNGGVRWTMSDFSRMNLEGNTLALYGSNGVVGRIGDNGFDFAGLPQYNVDVDGATPSDTSTVAAWEEVTGEDGSTYYRPLYQ